jgi:hypothetical protein
MVVLGSSGAHRSNSRTSLVRSPLKTLPPIQKTYLKFLKLLEGKAHLLHKLAVRDLEQRSLGAEARAAILSLWDIANGIYRRFLARDPGEVYVPVVCQPESILQWQPPLHGLT